MERQEDPKGSFLWGLGHEGSGKTKRTQQRKQRSDQTGWMNKRHERKSTLTYKDLLSVFIQNR